MTYYGMFQPEVHAGCVYSEWPRHAVVGGGQDNPYTLTRSRQQCAAVLGPAHTHTHAHAHAHTHTHTHAWVTHVHLTSHTNWLVPCKMCAQLSHLYPTDTYAKRCWNKHTTFINMIFRNIKHGVYKYSVYNKNLNVYEINMLFIAWTLCSYNKQSI